MQNLITMLSPTAPAPQPAAGNSAASAEDASSSKFAKLLGDAPSQNKQSNGKNPAPAQALVPVQAQEVAPEQAAALLQADQEKITQLLGKIITADDAKALLPTLEAMHQSGDDGLSDQAFEQLKDALEEIEARGEPTDVASLVDSLPVVAEAPEGESAPVLKRLLGWMQHALDKKEASQQAANANSTLQSLQASMFPAGDDAVAATLTQAAQPSQTQQQVDEEPSQLSEHIAHVAVEQTTVVVPLAQQHAMPEWVRKLGAGDENIASDAINEAIPPLGNMPENVEMATLPEVSLPEVSLPLGKAEAVDAKSADIATSTLPSSVDLASANSKGAIAAQMVADNKVSPKAFHEQLQALTDQVDATQVAVAPSAADSSSVQAMASVQQLNTTHAAAPLSHAGLVHLTPHTTAMEQVQVAITSGTKDGVDKITLQLEPADLGRVEVSMHISSDGKTQLSFLVDKAETMDALARDARSLERSLQEAGIKSDAGSMQFNLRQQPQPQFGQGFGNGKNGSQEAANDNESAAAAIAATVGGITKHYTINVQEGVDIHA